jgi:hypothetical protein
MSQPRISEGTMSPLGSSPSQGSNLYLHTTTMTRWCRSYLACPRLPSPPFRP